ncbi:hypothetical protein [Collinsella aerofaciens]|uniref:hypothetical protein n=1 Tax=Collinsella aerofaciens TaxID=74426 RepID=UPI0018656CA4|nr:hypothetical protein [Collinsella aerofaciens]
MTEQLVRQAVHPFDPFVLFALRHSKTSQQHRVRKRVLQQPFSKTGFRGQTKSRPKPCEILSIYSGTRQQMNT